MGKYKKYRCKAVNDKIRYRRARNKFISEIGKAAIETIRRDVFPIDIFINKANEIKRDKVLDDEYIWNTIPPGKGLKQQVIK